MTDIEDFLTIYGHSDNLLNNMSIYVQQWKCTSMEIQCFYCFEAVVLPYFWFLWYLWRCFSCGSIISKLIETSKSNFAFSDKKIQSKHYKSFKLGIWSAKLEECNSIEFCVLAKFITLLSGVSPIYVLKCDIPARVSSGT